MITLITNITRTVDIKGFSPLFFNNFLQKQGFSITFLVTVK